MDQATLITKLTQIEEHARLSLEYPKSLLAERQQMIIALARYLRLEARALSVAAPEFPGAGFGLTADALPGALPVSPAAVQRKI